MTLSATSLTTGQRCPRRFIYEASEPGRKWHPRELFAATLRQAVFELSNGVDKRKVTLNATTRYRGAATNPGIDAANPYVAAGDYCAALTTVIESLSRITLLSLVAGSQPLDVGTESHGYQVSAFTSQDGELHRWAVVDNLNEDSLYRELHSWHVFGDMAVSDSPMTVHFVEIGPFRDGRLRSPWCRAFKHPAIQNHYRFQSVTGHSLNGKWEPVWYAESKQDPVVWVDLMEKDNLSLIHHHQVKQLSPVQVTEGKRQIALEAARLASLGPVDLLPLNRPACDFPSVCPFQDLCYK
jgi:hypothetical protein